MIELSVFYGVGKTTKIYKVKNSMPFMVTCHDDEEDFTRTEFFMTQQEAEDFSEDWINE